MLVRQEHLRSLNALLPSCLGCLYCFPNVVRTKVVFEVASTAALDLLTPINITYKSLIQHLPLLQPTSLQLGRKMMDLGRMDFATLFKGNFSAMAENMTGGKSYSGDSKKMMESLLPMLGGQFNPVVRSLMFLYQMIGSHLGIDPTLILTLAGFIWAANRVARQVYGAIFRVIQDNFMSSIHVQSTDEIYAHMMKWLALQPLMASSRSLTAETVSKTAWEEEEELEALQTIRTTGSGDGEAEYLNFSNQEAKAVSSTNPPPMLSGSPY